MCVSRERDSSLGLRKKRNVSDITEYIHGCRAWIDRDVVRFIYLRTAAIN